MAKIDYQIFRGRPQKHTPCFPAAYCTDYISSSLAKKQYGTDLSVAYGYHDGQFYSMIEIGAKRDRFNKSLLKKIITDPSYLANIVQWSEEKTGSLQKLIKDSFPFDKINCLSDKQFCRSYEKYVDEYRRFHLVNTPPWWLMADIVAGELKKELSKEMRGESESAFQIMIGGFEYFSDNFNEELSLLDICALINQAKIKKIGHKNEMPLKAKKLFNRHIYDFSSMPFAYNTGIIWNEDYFIREINNILGKKEKPAEIKRNKLSSIKKQIAKRREFENKNKLSVRAIELAKVVRQLAYLQDLKKTVQTRSHPHLFNIVYPEISRRTGLEKKHYGYLSYFDIETILKQKNILPDQKKEFDERLKTCAVVMKDLEYDWLYGNEAIVFLKNAGAIKLESAKMREFKGVIASRGKITGRVKICLHSTEIKKVEKGDVLVSSMTTPDFVVAMKKSAAIVTDEGGITSHASIISRELKIPCIIGTKIATQILKDGDLVDVDADKGIVRIIKKAKVKN